MRIETQSEMTKLIARLIDFQETDEENEYATKFTVSKPITNTFPFIDKNTGKQYLVTVKAVK